MCFVTMAILLYQNWTVTCAIRQLPLILLALLTTYVVSNVMMHVWLRLGTGNANYLFFQGLCMWVAYGLFMVEYLKALISCRCVMSDAGKEKTD
ncbi:hypothetical protein EON63_05705 [archaeon]|nr:MAG: hypothetical protein EON63_05705 [archaeon]